MLKIAASIITRQGLVVFEQFEDVLKYRRLLPWNEHYKVHTYSGWTKDAVLNEYRSKLRKIDGDKLVTMGIKDRSWSTEDQT